jgi:hypothetical protein
MRIGNLAQEAPLNRPRATISTEQALQGHPSMTSTAPGRLRLHPPARSHAAEVRRRDGNLENWKIP